MRESPCVVCPGFLADQLTLEGQQPLDGLVPRPFYADFSSSVSQLLNTLWATLMGQK